MRFGGRNRLSVSAFLDRQMGFYLLWISRHFFVPHVFGYRTVQVSSLSRLQRPDLGTECSRLILEASSVA